MAGTAVVFLAAYASPIINPSMDGSFKSACRNLVWITWAIFAVEYVVRLWIASDKIQFVKSSPLALASIVLPIFRPLRLIRLVTLLNVLNRAGGSSFRGKVGLYVGSSVTVVVFVSALAVLDAERKTSEANIQSFGDAIWWAMTTISTVGYGDQFPVTTPGRFIAAGLMVTGIALLGVVTASIASWLVERVQEIEADTQTATHRDVQLLREEIGQLRENLLLARHQENTEAKSGE